MTSIKSEEWAVLISEVNELKKRIRQLECALGQKALDNNILCEAVRIGREKN